jgi:hypothetical protein
MSDTTTDASSAGNPFLEQIEEYLSLDNLESRLMRSPLTDIDVGVLGLQARHDLLDKMQEEMFEPASTSVEIVTRLFRLIRRGYAPRDPRKALVRKTTMTIASFAKKAIADLPWFTTFAKGMRIAGETGTGKSYEITRGLELLPQVIMHRQHTEAGWTHLAQVVWLYVAMSHDGSLGGLLLNILCALDAAIGTGYSSDKSLTGLSNEKLAVHIGIILRNHGVGVLVIDELQSRNFSGGARGGLAATFFLRMLNFGIPMVLMGNPLGMEVLDTFSQDMRRIGSGGSIDMSPLAEDDFDWEHCLAPALWRFNVMPEPSEIDDPHGKILFQYSGGIRDYACRIRVASQRIALDLGARALRLEHMEQAFLGPDFSDKERTLIRGFRDRDPILLQDFDDVRWKHYAVKWGCFKGSSSETGDHAQASGASGSETPETESAAAGDAAKKPRKPANVKDLETVKRNRTRKANAQEQQAKTRATLDPDDMRNTGLQEYLIAGFEALRTGTSQPLK